MEEPHMNKSLVNKSILAAAIGAGLAIPADATAVEQFFLKLSDVKGSSTNPDFKEYTEVVQWSFGMAQTDKGCEIKDLNITKEVDSVTPALVRSLGMGTIFLSGELKAVEYGANPEPEEHYNLQFKNLMVTHLDMGGQAGGESTPENVGFAVEEFQYNYTPHKDGDEELSDVAVDLSETKRGCS
jgi:type VI protein secretion system component Hcp